MSSVDQEIDAFLNGGGGRSAFPEDAPIGTTVKGVITNLEMQDQRDIKTGEVRRFPSGDPMRVLVITLDTAPFGGVGDDDDGLRRWYAKGGNFEVAQGEGKSAQAALKDALAACPSGTRLEVGGTLTGRKSGIGKKTQPGFSPPNLFQAKYEPPTKSIANEDW